MKLRTLPLTIAAQLLLTSALLSADKPKSLIVWPGYILDLPPNHCVEMSNGPDFHVLYLHDQQSPKHVILTGVCAGFAPNFEPDCAKPAKRTWTANGLTFESVRSADGCAEFLIHDAAKSDRGYLHVWFGPSEGTLADGGSADRIHSVRAAAAEGCAGASGLQLKNTEPQRRREHGGRISAISASLW
jgi:hypothetical protein